MKPGAPMAERAHVHAEAFMLMKYASEDGRVVEHVWNSRDGVTPFVIHSRDGVELRHVEWRSDRYLPEYKPKPGERMFVDLTVERAREGAASDVEAYWNASQWPMSQRYESKEAAVIAIAAAYLEQPGAPDLIEAKEVGADG